MSKNRTYLIGASILLLVVALSSEGSPRGERDDRRSHAQAAHRADAAVNFVSERELDVMTRAREALRVLVQTHPAPEVSRDLNQLISTHQVYLNFQEHAIGNEMNVASARLIRTPQGILLTLVVSPSLLLDPNTSHQFKQLVVYHEYIHIRQQLTGSQPAWLLIGLPAGTTTDDQLRIFINSEMEAYEAECQLAERIGATHAFDLCRVYSEEGVPAMRLAFAHLLADSPTYRHDADRVLRIGREH